MSTTATNVEKSRMIFSKVSRILTGVLELEEGDVELDKSIPTDLGADVPYLTQITSDVGKTFGYRPRQSDLFPGIFGIPWSLDIPLTYQILGDILEGFYEEGGADLSHVYSIHGGDTIIHDDVMVGHVFTVRLLCQTIAVHIGVEWEDPV